MFKTEREMDIYTAGIIDGEGCIGIHRKSEPTRVRYMLRVMVKNTFFPLIEFLQSNYGGSGTRNPASGNRRESITWELSSQKDLEKFIIRLYPFVLVKKQNMIIALNFINRDHFDKDEEYYEQMKNLNLRGIEGHNE